MRRGIEGEPIEMQGHRCPMCDRPLERIFDYPKIIIKDVVIKHIPDVIRNFPSEENISTEVQAIAKKPEVVAYLKNLSFFKGIERGPGPFLKNMGGMLRSR